MNFTQKIRDLAVPEGKVAVIWIGQAGFLLKTAQGKTILIDPYLSDYVYNSFKEEEGLAFKRMTAPLFEACEIIPDYLFISHEHGDHMDMESLPDLLKENHTCCYGNITAVQEGKSSGINHEIKVMEKHRTYDFGEFRVTGVDCDHGELSKEALGFIFDFGFVKIYYSGDTSYNKIRLTEAMESRPEIALLPINGAFGNLNSEEAAEFAADIEAKVCVPHHFWTFPKHLGNPLEAIAEFAEKAPNCRLAMCTPGEVHLFGAFGNSK